MKQNIPISDPHVRPEGADDATIAAVGKVTEALEWVERARGDLYNFHQKIGHADNVFGEAIKALEAAGHNEQAQLIREEIVGRNVLPGRWTFQVIEEFNNTYYLETVAAEQRVRDELLDGRQHVYESELKEGRRTKNKPGHEARPDEGE